MTHKQQIMAVARHAGFMVRVARQSRQPRRLLDSVNGLLEKLWDLGCHSDTLSSDDKETARRCVSAVEKMISREKI